jgi:tetratricopeptide (TPR) repeat protein
VTAYASGSTPDIPSGADGAGAPGEQGVLIQIGHSPTDPNARFDHQNEIRCADPLVSTPSVERPKPMHVRRTILCLATIFFWSACEPHMNFGQSSELMEAEGLYKENYQRAATAQNAGDFSGAEEWHRTNLTLVESTPGVPPEFRVQARSNLASAIMNQSKLDEAESILDEAQDVLDANPHIDSFTKGHLLVNRGALEGKQHEFKVADEMLEEGLAILEDTIGLSNAVTASGQIELARVQVQLGKLKKAEGNYRHGLRVLSDLGFSESNPYFVDATDEHEALLERLGIQQVRLRLLTSAPPNNPSA